MVTRPRWVAECDLIANVFPEFAPYSANGMIGFHGKLQGPQTGRIYVVTMQASTALYPQVQPAVYITPRPESHHWEPDGNGGDKLCVVRTWKPAMSTFANTLLVTAKYIAEFDGSGTVL
jgi:hypothetical protein